MSMLFTTVVSCDYKQKGGKSTGKVLVHLSIFVFLLIRSPSEECFTIFPWLNNFNNLKCLKDQIRGVKFPDVNPSSLPEDSSFSMIAGDFLDVYTSPGKNLTFVSLGVLIW